MKTYFAIKREIFKNNSSKPDETLFLPTLYKTEEDAVRAARKDQDFSSLHYGYLIMKQPLVSIQEVKKSNGKIDSYRHEWSIIKYQLEEAKMYYILDDDGCRLQDEDGNVLHPVDKDTALEYAKQDYATCEVNRFKEKQGLL